VSEIDIARLIADQRRDAIHKSDSVVFKIARKPPNRWMANGAGGRANAAQFDVDLHALLRLDGAEFVRKAYIKVLGRRPDPAGGAFFLSRLRGRWTDKVGVIQALRASEEGRVRGARVRGLRLAALYRVLFTAPDLSFRDLMRHDGPDFVHNAYRQVLGREADSDGFASQLKKLEHGWLGKVRVLANLRYGPEGQARNISIGGLGFAIVLKNLYVAVISLPRRAVTYLGRDGGVS